MKQTLFLLLAAATIAACNDEGKKIAEAPKNTELITQNLKGKVQRYESRFSIIDSSGSSNADSSIYIHEFNENGYQTSYVTRDLNGNIKGEQLLIHHENGALKELTIKNGEGKQIRKWEITIDSNGKYNSATIYDSAGKVSSTMKKLKENEYGQVTSGTEYKPDGSVNSSFASDYDKANLIGGWGKDSSGKEYFRNTITLNNKGDAIEETTTSVIKDSTRTEKFTYKYDSYDEMGNWTQMTTYNEKGKPTRVTKRTFTYYKD